MQGVIALLANFSQQGFVAMDVFPHYGVNERCTLTLCVQ